MDEKNTVYNKYYDEAFDFINEELQPQFNLPSLNKANKTIVERRNNPEIEQKYKLEL